MKVRLVMEEEDTEILCDLLEFTRQWFEMKPEEEKDDDDRLVIRTTNAFITSIKMQVLVNKSFNEIFPVVGEG